MTALRFSLDAPPFAGCTGRGIRVAVVDSGVAAGHSHVGSVSPGVSLVTGVDDTLDRIGHGTAVAAAIREKAPDVELVPVKVFDWALRTDARTLADAIRWASDHDCRVANLSLGTANTEHAALLEDAVRYAAERGTLVVAALESDGTHWLPGGVYGVAAVLGDADLDRDALTLDTGRDDGEDADGTGSAGVVSGDRFSASVYPRPIPGVPRERNLHGTSFAVANTTGFLVRLLEREPELRTVSELSALLRATMR